MVWGTRTSVTRNSSEEYSAGSQPHVIFGDSRHNGLNRFLAEFLSDLEPPAGSKLGRVTPRLRVTQAVLDDGFKRRQKI